MANEIDGADETIDDYIPGIGRLVCRAVLMDLHLDPGVDDDTARTAAEAAAKEIRGSISVYRDEVHLFTVTSEGIS